MTPGVESRVAYIRIYILNYILEFTFGCATTRSCATKASLELALLAVRPCLVHAQRGTSQFPGTPGRRGRTRKDFFRRLLAVWCVQVPGSGAGRPPRPPPRSWRCRPPVTGDKFGQDLDQAQVERGAKKSATLTCSIASNSSQSWDASGIPVVFSFKAARSWALQSARTRASSWAA